MLGQVIQRYKIHEKIGDGGMGVVYKAEDTQLHRMVALKFLPKELSSDPVANENLFREARAASALDHPNICTIHEIGETDDGQPFICMAYYGGETLAAKIEKGSLTISSVIECVTQVAKGLQKAHEGGIVHRDIKPANIVVTDDGIIKILDFGLASIASWKFITQRGSTVGTATYMSPEQIRGEQIDCRSDIWSLGICFYEMITGKPPFEGDYEPALMYAILNDEPGQFPNLQPQRSMQIRSAELERVQRVIRKCLEKRQDDRYQSMHEFLLDLGATPTPDLHDVPQQVRQESRYSAPVRWSIGVVLVIAIVGVVFLLSRQFSSHQPELKRKSIAVLPFKNLDDNREDEYFSDGMTEDVITRLSRFGDLTVISRTSVMQYKNTTKSIPEIARELNVGTILEGSVRRSGDNVRIVSQLIDANTDTHIWSETYDRRLKDVFLIQGDVAQKIAQALKVTLRSDGSIPSPERKEGNITAYEYYLKGREYYYRFNKSDNEYAVAQFKRALELEPSYAAALAGLADAYAQRVAKFGFSPAWVDSSIALSTKAVALDGDLAEAHKALALSYSGKGWHRKSAQAYAKSVELNPNYFTAVNNLGVEYLFMGEYDTALNWFKKSIPLNPTFAFLYYTVAGTYSNLEEYEKANAWFKKCLEIQPDFQYVHSGEAIGYLRQGNNQRAFNEAEQILKVTPNDIEGLTLAGWSKLFGGNYVQSISYFEKAWLIDSINSYWYGTGRTTNTAFGFIYKRLGQTDNAKKMFLRSRLLDQAQLEHQNEWYTIRYDLALISAQEGKKTEAYRWLREAFNLGWRDYLLAERDPLLEDLRGDPEFKRILSDVHARVLQMRKRADIIDND
jgi:serine/threonine protein kinase/Tfp pilus assembly protein PilF